MVRRGAPAAARQPTTPAPRNHRRCFLTRSPSTRTAAYSQQRTDGEGGTRRCPRNKGPQRNDVGRVARRTKASGAHPDAKYAGPRTEPGEQATWLRTTTLREGKGGENSTQAAAEANCRRDDRQDPGEEAPVRPRSGNAEDTRLTRPSGETRGDPRCQGGTTPPHGTRVQPGRARRRRAVVCTARARDGAVVPLSRGERPRYGAKGGREGLWAGQERAARTAERTIKANGQETAPRAPLRAGGSATRRCAGRPCGLMKAQKDREATRTILHAISE